MNDEDLFFIKIPEMEPSKNRMILYQKGEAREKNPNNPFIPFFQKKKGERKRSRLVINVVGTRICETLWLHNLLVCDL